MLGIYMQGTGVVTSAKVNLERPWLGCFAIVAKLACASVADSHQRPVLSIPGTPSHKEVAPIADVKEHTR